MMMNEMTGQIEAAASIAPFKVDTSRGRADGRVSSEWFTRPDDERYLNLNDLYAAVHARKVLATAKVIETRTLRVEADRDEPERLALRIPSQKSPPASSIAVRRIQAPPSILAQNASRRARNVAGMNADDFRDYMLSFLFLRYLSDNYEAAAKRELGPDYPDLPEYVLERSGASTPLQAWYEDNPNDVAEFEKQMRRKVHYVIQPPYLWNNIAKLARTQSDELLLTLYEGFKYIENESFQSTFGGLFSEINLYSEKLGKT